MKFIKLFDSYIKKESINSYISFTPSSKITESLENKDILIIIDVQKSFRKYFSEMYLHELKKYCGQFSEVYQIWDNHSEGKNPDTDYLYDDQPDMPINDDLYYFTNQKDLIEKRYRYNVDVDFFKKILDKETYKVIKHKETKGLLKRGEIFETTEGTHIVYIGNNHKWYHLGKKMYKLFIKLKGKPVIIVGGADSECLEDIYITMQSIGVNIKRNWKFIYTASSCPIR